MSVVVAFFSWFLLALMDATASILYVSAAFVCVRFVAAAALTARVAGAGVCFMRESRNGHGNKKHKISA